MKSARPPIKCIFCLEVKQPSKEHIFPEAIGGKLSVFIVCTDCNNWLGGKIDSHLTSLPSVQLRRAQLGIAGKRGGIPHGFEILTGRSFILAENGGRQAAWVTYDREKNATSFKLEPTITERKNDEGQTVVQFSGDPSDLPKLMQKLQATRRREGLRPLTDEELEKISREAVASEFTSPLVERTIKIDVFGVCLAFAKIAYELAFHWFGGKFSEDPYAEIFREAVRMGEADNLVAHIHLLDQKDVVRIHEMWRRDQQWHIAFATYMEGHTIVFITIFDSVGAAIKISQRNWLAPSRAMKKSFVAQNSQTGEVYEANLAEEFSKMKRINAASKSR
ncbi:HNH endonuclease [Agrobacterium salinitolerans]|uniref:HNH endonuclease n=1 Tax=Agrobacterium salinitolerans TaxID=1183413 RepID=UPI0022BF3628|nr:hypothetical protein [Agrobacterium salinitolerans]